MSPCRCRIRYCGAVSACVWLLVGSPFARPTVADVIVLANKCTSEVRFRMAVVGNTQEEYVLDPDAVMTIPLSSDYNKQLVAHVNSRQYDLVPNSAYYFCLAPGGIGLRKVVFGQPEPDSEAAAAPGVLAPPDAETVAPTEVVSVKLLVDDEQRENAEKSNQRLSKRLQAASEVIRQLCGIRFEIGSFERWESDDRIKELTELQRDFERKVDPKPAWLAIGFTSQHRATRGSTQWEEGLKPFCTHILLSDWVDQTTEMERVELLVHALGRYLGGVENPEPKSVMRPSVGDYQARLRTFALVFDPANALAINLMAEQIRHGVRSWPDLSDHAKSQLSDIYSRIGKSDLWAESHPGFATVFRQLAAPQYSMSKVDGSLAAGVDVRTDELDASGDLVRLALDDPVRWFRREDTSPPKTPASYVEFVGGDRLPGKVVGVQAEATAATGLPRHLIIQTPGSLTWSGRTEGRIHVRERWLRRIVWETQKDRPYRAGTLYTRDGRELHFHLLRLLDEAAQILQESGVVRIPFSEIAELDFPWVDPWQAYFEQLAILTPKCDRRLMQLETAGGGRFTTSLSRLSGASATSARAPQGQSVRGSARLELRSAVDQQVFGLPPSVFSPR